MTKKILNMRQHSLYNGNQLILCPTLNKSDGHFHPDKKLIAYMHITHHWLLQNNGACHSGGCYWDYYPGALSLSQVTATHLQIVYP